MRAVWREQESPGTVINQHYQREVTELCSVSGDDRSNNDLLTMQSRWDISEPVPRRGFMPPAATLGKPPPRSAGRKRLVNSISEADLGVF